MKSHKINGGTIWIGQDVWFCDVEKGTLCGEVIDIDKRTIIDEEGEEKEGVLIEVEVSPMEPNYFVNPEKCYMSETLLFEDYL